MLKTDDAKLAAATERLVRRMETAPKRRAATNLMGVPRARYIQKN
jgi:hypothetical protein